MAEPLPLYQRVGVLRPLQHRDFRLLWIGQTVSMIGDGIYIFAVAWFVYKDLHASPATFALVGFAWSAPQVLLLLATGALSDRMDRRHLMIIGDLLRLCAITAIGTLILLDALTAPLLVALVLPYGAGQAIFGPAFSSIVPMIVPEEHLVEANSIASTVRPLAWLVIGPTIGAVVVHIAGTGWAFLVDAFTFAVSAACIWMMRVRGDRYAHETETHLWADVKEGIRYVGATRWLLWGMLGGMVSLFCVWGPWETLVPFVVADQLRGTELQLAVVFGAGGVGSVVGPVSSVVGPVGSVGPDFARRRVPPRVDAGAADQSGAARIRHRPPARSARQRSPEHRAVRNVRDGRSADRGRRRQRASVAAVL